MSQHENDALQVQGDRVVLGEWSGDLEELIAKNVTLRQMLRKGRADEARALLKAQAVEEQAALVAIDENPEEVLSLTGMDAQGRPGYLPAVVDKLPSEIIAELVAPGEYKLARFNTALLQDHVGGVVCARSGRHARSDLLPRQPHQGVVGMARSRRGARRSQQARRALVQGGSEPARGRLPR